MTECRAYQASDHMMCECGRQWDTNDPVPPQCPRERLAAVCNHMMGIEMSGKPFGRDAERYAQLKRERALIQKELK